MISQEQLILLQIFTILSASVRHCFLNSLYLPESISLMSAALYDHYFHHVISAVQTKLLSYIGTLNVTVSFLSLVLVISKQSHPDKSNNFMIYVIKYDYKLNIF